MDKLDDGEQIIIQRGKNKAYAITPITEEDVYFTPSMIKKIKEAIIQVKDGKTQQVDAVEELENFFKNL